MRNRKAVGWGELIVGVLLIILGIYTFIRPAAALEGVTLIYGIFALVTGIMDIVYYVKLEQRTGFAPAISLVSGIISVIAGVFILFNIVAGKWALLILFPIWFIMHCIGRLSHLPFVRLTCGSGYYYFTIIVNIIGLILGFMMILNPVLSFLSASYIIAIYLLILGIDSVIFSLALLDSRN